MKAGELAQLMEMELLLPDMAGQEMALEGCYIGDLLSNVMGKAQTGQLWLTVMTNINVLAVAQLLELSGIVLLEDNKPVEGVLERAAEEGIPVFITKESAYRMAVRFYEWESGR
jgi:hypothetical protein